MAQPQENIQIAAPGFYGLNTQDSPVGLPPAFAAQADNCVIDAYGRIASRKGLHPYTTDPEDSGNIDVNYAETCHEYVQEDGTRILLFAGDDDTNTPALWNQTSGGGASSPLTGVAGWTANNWDFTDLSDVCYMAQANHDIYQTTNGTSVAAMAEQPAAFGGGSGLVDPDILITAFGRLWCARGTGNHQTVQWSQITDSAGYGTGLSATPWSVGGGVINIEEYWPNGSDEIVGLAQHNNFLVIFGARSILLYNVPTSEDPGASTGPAYMTLSDTIDNIGCVARDSIVSTGTDILFLSASGVRSLNRTIQEKSVPIGDISKNVRDELRDFFLGLDTSTIPVRAVYSPEEAVYILFMPAATEINSRCYVFDSRYPLEDGSWRATRWVSSGLRCGMRTDAGELLIGRQGGLYEYTGGEDKFVLTGFTDVPVAMTYWTHQQNFDKPSNLKFPKQVDVILIGGASVELTVSWRYDFSDTTESYTISRSGDLGDLWGQGLYDTAQYGELGGLISLEHVNMWGHGRNVAIGFVGDITVQPVSIQELNLQALLGRIL